MSMLHILNLSLSYSTSSRDQCIWYFLNFAIDSLIGMALCYLLLNLIERCLQNSSNFAFKSGYYGETPEIGMWAYQLWIWIGIILIVKGIIWLSMNLFQKPLHFFGEMILLPFEGHPELELVMIMIIIPLVLNSLIFWITDSFLKNDKGSELEYDLELLPESNKKMISSIN